VEHLGIEEPGDPPRGFRFSAQLSGRGASGLRPCAAGWKDAGRLAIGDAAESVTDDELRTYFTHIMATAEAQAVCV
jgi:hypothetical protein